MENKQISDKVDTFVGLPPIVVASEAERLAQVHAKYDPIFNDYLSVIGQEIRDYLIKYITIHPEVSYVIIRIDIPDTIIGFKEDSYSSIMRRGGEIDIISIIKDKIYSMIRDRYCRGIGVFYNPIPPVKSKPNYIQRKLFMSEDYVHIGFDWTDDKRMMNVWSTKPKMCSKKSSQKMA